MPKCNKINFYDPLYDFITFEDAEQSQSKDAFLGGFSSDVIRSSSKKIKPYIYTFEFNRLSFLRQSGLAFLVFPSSTHTRYAHAIGCCYLGYLASRSITVGSKISEGNAYSYQLSDWLDDQGLKEEFLLSLLLHDIGHFSFSHTVETNDELWFLLDMHFTHEDAACEILSGQGMFFDAIKSRAGDDSNVKFVHELLKTMPDIDIEYVSYLITGDLSFIANKSLEVQSRLEVLHQLTSGLLDLDRIDHYRRDSYFSGIKFASNLNFASLLNGFSIYYDTQKISQHEIRLSRPAIGHALTLLHAKERLSHDVFDNENNIAYGVMLNHALNLFLFGPRYFDGKKSEIDLNSVLPKLHSLLALSDDELLFKLEMAGDEFISKIINRIKNKNPYTFIGKFYWPKKPIHSPLEFRKYIAEKLGLPAEKVVIKRGKSFNAARAKRPTEWLNLDCLADDNGNRLEIHEEYKRQVQYFKSIQDEIIYPFWVFLVEKPAQSLRSISDTLRQAIS